MRRGLGIVIIAIIGGWATPAAHGADERIEATVLAMDAAGLTITVTVADGTEKKLDLLKKVKVTVNGDAVAAADVRRGHKVLLTYNPDLEVVTRIDATGEVAPEPELAVLSELPDPQLSKGSPWLSEDGLTLYWKSVPPGDTQVWIWTASRKTPNDLFEDVKRVVAGNDPTVTGDGLEMVVLLKDRLLTTSRATAKDAFQRPRTLTELQPHGFLAAPCLSSDGLKLYADRLDLEKKTVELVEMTRSSRKAKWGEPVPVKFTGWEGARQRFLHVTPDGRYALATLQQQVGEWDTAPIVVWQSDPKGKGFVSPRIVTHDGKPVGGKFPRYVAATRELFFARRKAGTMIDEIVAIRGFDPEVHTRELTDAEHSQRAGGNEARQAAIDSLQGEWLTTREERLGKALTAAELRETNRRIVIKGQSFDMTRTHDGKPGTYRGEFDVVDPGKGHFDWKGKAPGSAPLELRGIFEVSGDALKLCYVFVQGNTPRPKEFHTDPNSASATVLTLKRAPKPGARPGSD